jgi:hypothetical protein
MRYIAAVSGGSGEIDKVKRIILETNPLLESFGNAKTLRNNNSSRFGKYFEIQFNGRGDPDGGRITNYLLEKSRVVGQLPGERNYHVFYQWTKAGAADEKQMFGIQSPEQFEYLIRGQCVTVNGLDDAAEYRDMRQALNVIGITPQEQRDIFTLLGSILWIGNCQLREVGGNAQVADMGVVDFVASLLGVGSKFLKAAFEVRTMETKKGLKKGSTYKVPLNYVQANASRDALAKTVYDRLFDWLCTRVNQAMYKAADGLVIGVLDIFGFEIFDKNGFEQLCVRRSLSLPPFLPNLFCFGSDQLCERKAAANLHRVHAQERAGRVRARGHSVDADPVFQQQDREIFARARTFLFFVLVSPHAFLLRTGVRPDRVEEPAGRDARPRRRVQVRARHGRGRRQGVHAARDDGRRRQPPALPAARRALQHQALRRRRAVRHRRHGGEEQGQSLQGPARRDRHLVEPDAAHALSGGARRQLRGQADDRHQDPHAGESAVQDAGGVLPALRSLRTIRCFFLFFSFLRSQPICLSLSLGADQVE